MQWAGGAVARVRSWSIQSNLDTLETTNLGQIAREYVPGLKSATGSASIFYHDDNASLRTLLDNCIATGEPTSASLNLVWGTKSLTFEAYVNSVSITIFQNGWLGSEAKMLFPMQVYLVGFLHSSRLEGRTIFASDSNMSNGLNIM